MSDYIINFTDPLKGSFVIRPYTSNGPKFPTTSILNDTSIAASSTLLLYGKGHPEYGERTDENLLNLLEHFSGATEPAIKVAGMLWHREVLYYKDTGGGFYVAGSGSPQWTSIALFGTGALPGSPPIGLQDGDYWWDNTGSPTVLYQYSADERNINDWLVREFDEASGVPTADPVREMQIYDGSAWDILPDLSAVTALISATLSDYLRLDTTNDPLTGDLEIAKVSPALDLTGSDPVITLTGASPRVHLAGSDPTVQFAGATNYQVSENSDILEIRVGGTAGANVWFEVDRISGYLTHGNDITATAYATNINGVDNALASVKYVDDQVAGAIIGDTFINGGTFGITGSPDTGTLTMPYSTGSPGGALVVTGFDSDNIPFTSGVVGFIEPATTVDDALTKAAPLNNPTFTGQVNVPTVGGGDPGSVAATKAYVDAEVAAVTASVSITEAQRSVQVGGSTSFTLPFNYIANNNRLMVFKNGVKQYKDELASATATFSPIVSLDQTVAGLGPVGDYIITAVNTGTNTWSISGNHAGDFALGDTIEVGGNSDPASNITYTVVSSTFIGPDTDIVVTSIPGTAFADGAIGIHYEFFVVIDGVQLPGGSPAVPLTVSGLAVSTFADLTTQMQAAVDAAYGSGTGAVYLHGGNIRLDSLTLPSGSPAPSAIFLPGPNPTTNLFGGTNLGIDGFAFFSGNSATTYAYFESDGGSPAGLAASNSAASNIEFNVATLGTDVLEFLLV